MSNKSTFNFDKDASPKHFNFLESSSNDDELIFQEEQDLEEQEVEGCYKILVVDDDEDVHSATRLILSDFTFEGKKLNILHAHSAKEARQTLADNPDIALAFLDVVMETSDAGLRLVKEIRETFRNPYIRIVLRTGQPGYAPERKVVLDYDINDYKTKTELTANKVITVLVASLRSYNSLIALDDLNQNLHKRVEERTAELKQKNELLDAAVQTKNKLFSIIGHDLRGPIGNVKNMLEALVNQPSLVSNETTHTSIKQLHKNAAQTYTLLENLLLWARNEQGEAVFSPYDFDINLAAYESISLLESVAHDKGIKIKTNIRSSNPVYADQRMIATVFRNLIANAIKFSKSGDVISVLMHRQGSSTEVSIADQGIGITDENIAKILNPHEVYTTFGTKNEKGSGLGLTLSKAFIEKNGGKLTIESEPNKGSTFKFTVPNGRE